MSNRNVETLLSFHCLTGMDTIQHQVIYVFIQNYFFLKLFTCLFSFSPAPLINNPVCDMDIDVNKLRLKYRTYIAKYDVEEV